MPIALAQAKWRNATRVVIRALLARDQGKKGEHMAYETQIRGRSTCRRCGGAGAVLSPAWDEYYRAGEIESILRERAKAPDGPEEIDCPDCRGTGFEEFWMTIKTLRVVLGIDKRESPI